jgi:hypothetical protein
LWGISIKEALWLFGEEVVDLCLFGDRRFVLPVKDTLPFLHLIILWQFGCFVTADPNRKLAFEFCLPNIVDQIDLLAHHPLRDFDFLQVQKGEVATVLSLEEQPTSIEMVELLHLFWGELEEESFTAVGVGDGNVSVDGTEFEGDFRERLVVVVGGN